MSKEMTAKEAFEKLGYKHEFVIGGFGYVGNEYTYKQPNNGALKILMFMEAENELHISNETDYGISANEILAITQQMKELGWLE